jgi:hypothetical protein
VFGPGGNPRSFYSQMARTAGVKVILLPSQSGGAARRLSRCRGHHKRHGRAFNSNGGRKDRRTHRAFERTAASWKLRSTSPTTKARARPTTEKDDLFDTPEPPFGRALFGNGWDGALKPSDYENEIPPLYAPRANCGTKVRSLDVHTKGQTHGHPHGQLAVAHAGAGAPRRAGYHHHKGAARSRRGIPTRDGLLRRKHLSNSVLSSRSKKR